MIEISISVIIPVYNEEHTISHCLESLKGQTLKPKEIIVVDDGSTDKTFKKIARLQAAGYKLQVLRNRHKGAGAARNLGASKASGDILAFVDADMCFNQEFLEELTKPICNGMSKGTFSKQEFISNWGNIWARFWNYWRGLYEPIAVPKNFPNHSPVFRAILRSEFQKVGGFDEKRGYNDDWSLSGKLGYEATETFARFYHNNPSSFQDVFFQAQWTGKRQYRFGLIGSLGVLAREFPLWATFITWYRIWREREHLAESFLGLTVFCLIFSLIVQTGLVLGIIGFVVFEAPQK